MNENELMEAVEVAIKDATADMGAEIVESGGWVEITRAVVDMSDASPGVKAEVLRMHGLAPAGPDTELDDQAVCPRHGPTTVVSSGTYTGYAGGRCYYAELGCGCTDADESGDVEAAR